MVYLYKNPYNYNSKKNCKKNENAYLIQAAII